MLITDSPTLASYIMDARMGGLFCVLHGEEGPGTMDGSEWMDETAGAVVAVSAALHRRTGPW